MGFSPAADTPILADMDKTAVRAAHGRGVDAALDFFGVKAAATVDQLHAAYKRLNPLRVRANPTLEIGAGASVSPKRVAKARFIQTGAPKERIPAALASMPDNLRGKILLPGSGAHGPSGVLRRILGDALPAASGAGRRATNVAVGLHEGFERGVKPEELGPIFSHASPKVLLNEHNMLSRMTGPGSDEARAAFAVMRARNSETDALRARLRDTYGDRALSFLQAGEKIPAALRRDLVRKMNQESRSIDPSDVASRIAFETKMKAPHPVKAFLRGKIKDYENSFSYRNTPSKLLTDTVYDMSNLARAATPTDARSYLFQRPVGYRPGSGAAE